MSGALATRPVHFGLEITAEGRIALIAFAQDDSLESMVFRLAPAVAARLGQALIDMAWKLETP